MEITRDKEAHRRDLSSPVAMVSTFGCTRTVTNDYITMNKAVGLLSISIGRNGFSQLKMNYHPFSRDLPRRRANSSSTSQSCSTLSMFAGSNDPSVGANSPDQLYAPTSHWGHFLPIFTISHGLQPRSCSHG